MKDKQIAMGNWQSFRPRPWIILMTLSMLAIWWYCIHWTCPKDNPASLIGSLADTRHAVHSRSPAVNSKWFQYTCAMSSRVLEIDNLMETIQIWKKSKNQKCRTLLETFQRVFSVNKDYGKISFSNSFHTVLLDLMKNNSRLVNEMKNQSVTMVYNKVTQEGTVFNPLRAKRPIPQNTQSELDHVKNLTEKSAIGCHFCLWKRFTAEDVFGRIVSDHCFTAANAFKVDAWHSMVIFRTHDPHNWTMAQFMDVFRTATRWFADVHRLDSAYRYPMILWDLLPHASASQVHPHIHVVISKYGYHGKMAALRTRVELYSRDHRGRDYFTDLVQGSAALGLTASVGGAKALASLTPIRDDEIFLLGEQGSDDFYKLLYFVTRAFIDDLQKLCFSLAISVPEMRTRGQVADQSTPLIGRIVTRGRVNDVRSDVSSMELFAAANVNVDPFAVARAVVQSVEARYSRQSASQEPETN